jgi:hypothetical protein
MKVVKLDKRDITHLVRLMLEADNNPAPPAPDPTKQSEQGTPQGELSDTKSELVKQIKNNINQLIADQKVGSIIALFILLLTDKESALVMRMVGNKFQDHMEGGGKETDFTAAVTRSLQPLAKRFIDALVKSLQKKNEMDDSGDVWESELKEMFADVILERRNARSNSKKRNRDADKQQQYFDLKASSTKTKLRQNAINRVNKMSSNPDIIRVFSMFLLYLTDKQTVSQLRALASTYGERLDEVIDNSQPSWTQNLVKEVLTTFMPLVKGLVKSVDNELQKAQAEAQKNLGAENAGNAVKTFQADQSKAKEIAMKYKLSK